MLAAVMVASPFSPGGRAHLLLSRSWIPCVQSH